MVEKGGREVATGITITSPVNRLVAKAKTGVLDVPSSLHGKEGTIAAYPAGEGAVEDIYPTGLSSPPLFSPHGEQSLPGIHPGPQ
jgi:hypothetical protein